MTGQPVGLRRLVRPAPFDGPSMQQLRLPDTAIARNRHIARGNPYHAHSVSRIAVKSRGQTLFLKVSEIDWIEAASYYACLHLGGATHIVRRTIQDLEQDLDARTFLDRKSVV